MSWLPTIVTSPPSVEPITIDEARAQVKLAPGDTDFDVELNIYIQTARTHVEQYTGTKLINQSVQMQCSQWKDLARLPMAPLSAIASIKYLDTTGTLQTLDPSVYQAFLPGLRPYVRLAFNQVWPPLQSWCNVPDAITIAATAGYGAAEANIPAPIRHAMLLLISQWFDNRQDFLIGGRFDPLPNVSPALLANYCAFPIS